MPKVEVSVGELLDKITILQIKQEYITDENKLKYIREELSVLQSTVDEENIQVPEELVDELRSINRELWDVEDVIRACELDEDFGPPFIESARHDAILNDKRFLAKNKINTVSQSLIKEQKSYEGLYTAD